MTLRHTLLSLQLVATLAGHLSAQARTSPPVLSFPEKGLDDTAAYQGYSTRFYRDWARNTVQIYLDGRTGRIVHLLANAEDESIGLTARAAGAPVKLRWGAARATVSSKERRRAFQYQLLAEAPRVTVGFFLLGSMRVERDFQYANGHKRSFGATRYSVAEVDRLIAAMDRLPAAERDQDLHLLNAGSTAELRTRTRSRVTLTH